MSEINVSHKLIPIKGNGKVGLFFPLGVHPVMDGSLSCYIGIRTFITFDLR